MNSEEELTIEKFHACTGIKESLLREWILLPTPSPGKSEYDFRAFYKILDKNDIEKYSNLLYHYMLWEVKHIKSEESFINSMKLTYNLLQEDINLKKNLTDILSFLLSKEKGSLNSFTINKQQGSKSISNKIIIDSIGKSLNEFVTNKLIEVFKEREYNLETFTEEEAEEAIRQKHDLTWITNWKMKEEYYDHEGNRIYDDDFEDHTDYFNYETGECHNGSFIKNQMIQDYAESHVTRREVNLDFLKKVKADGFSHKKNSGAHEKNKYVKSIISALVDLKRIDKFIDSNDDITEIEQIILESKDFRFVYDCLDLFKLFVLKKNTNQKQII